MTYHKYILKSIFCKFLKGNFAIKFLVKNFSGRETYKQNLDPQNTNLKNEKFD